MAYYTFDGAFANLNSAIDGIGRQIRDNRKQTALADLGKDIGSGNYDAAAQKAFALGDADAGIKLATLGKTARQEAEWTRSNGGLLGIGSPQAADGATTQAAAIGTPNEIENRFVSTVKNTGLTNPVGLGAVAAYGKAESGFNPQNVNRSWSDPSESGQPGTAGGIMSWRAERLANLQNFAKQRGEEQPSVETQALFLAQEDPSLIPKLQAAKTPQEANQIMANAWRFAGYNREGGENARRLALTQQYAQRFGGQGGAPVTVPPQVAMTEADVQRLEAQQGNPVIDEPAAPVEMAQAAPQQGTPMADLPAQGATPAQGFAIPGQTEASIANDPRVLNLQRALAGAPERFKPSIQSRLNILVEELKAQRQQGGPLDQENKRLQNEKMRRELQGEGATPLTPEERKAIGVPDTQAAYKTRSGEIKFGPAGTTIKNEPPPPTGYRYVRDAQGNIERAEPIPGSKAAQEAEEAATKKERSDRIKAETGTTVGNALDDIDRLMASATLPTTGAMGARVANIPGTAAYDIGQALTTIGANISFAQLQQMREASPTGGALGAVSDNEQKLLQNSYAALSQSQSEGQFKTNLGRVRAVFERIVHGRTLTPQERKTGGPMTIERAKGLRAEASQAIANGADKSAVMKRLKEDYGISAEGL